MIIKAETEVFKQNLVPSQRGGGATPEPLLGNDTGPSMKRFPRFVLLGDRGECPNKIADRGGEYSVRHTREFLRVYVLALATLQSTPDSPRGCT